MSMNNPPRPSFLRHSGSFSPVALTSVINIIGCGAIGSTTAMVAARMGWSKFQLWDSDEVEDFNLPNQAFFPRHIGVPKVLALKELLQEFNPDIQVEVHQRYFVSDDDCSALEGPVVIATDSMKSRADITKAFSFNPKVPVVLEARLGFDYGEIHVIDPLDAEQIKGWKSTLRGDDEIPDGPCNLRICPTLVGVVSNTLVHYLCTPYALQRSDQGVAESPPFETKFILRGPLHTRVVKLQP